MFSFRFIWNPLNAIFADFLCSSLVWLLAPPGGAHTHCANTHGHGSRDQSPGWRSCNKCTRLTTKSLTCAPKDSDSDLSVTHVHKYATIFFRRRHHETGSHTQKKNTEKRKKKPENRKQKHSKTVEAGSVGLRDALQRAFVESSSLLRQAQVGGKPKEATTSYKFDGYFRALQCHAAYRNQATPRRAHGSGHIWSTVVQKLC